MPYLPYWNDGLRAAIACWILAAPAAAVPVTFEWVDVGNPGNAADAATGFGAVAEAFRIAKHEVTNAQYAAFLNSVAAEDPYTLYSTSMATGFGGIVRSGASGSYSYAPIAGREQMPVNYVSFYDTLRFANWLHNGQGGGDTENGAYTLLGGTPSPSGGDDIVRNPGAQAFLPTEDEWYKAAYHNAVGLTATDYYEYPFGTDTQTTCSAPPGGTNHANCLFQVGDTVDVGSYPASVGPYGTFDGGGNVWEWNDGLVDPGIRAMRGGGFYIGPNTLASSWRDRFAPTGEFSFAGFRVATPIPEPGTGLLLLSGLLGLGAQRGKASEGKRAKTEKG